MKHTPALIAISVFTLLGLLLSGYLSYVNLWGPGCTQGFLSSIVSCGGPQKVLIFGQPTCVYGFFMYLAVALITIWGFTAKDNRRPLQTILGLGILGTAFSGGLTIYELWILKLQFSTLPACVYGLVLYAGILITSIVALKKTPSAPAQPPPITSSPQPPAVQ